MTSSKRSLPRLRYRWLVGFLARAFAVERGPVDQEDIQQSVVIEIEDRDPGAGAFEDVLLVVRAAGDVDGGEACLRAMSRKSTWMGGRVV